MMCMQLTGSTVGELITVPDMHQRKAEMARQADAFIALPGSMIISPLNGLQLGARLGFRCRHWGQELSS
jgi:hypothetical protein